MVCSYMYAKPDPAPVEVEAPAGLEMAREGDEGEGASLVTK
jgi:hypothetical protein